MRNAVTRFDPKLGTDVVFFRCEYHGTNKNPLRATEPTCEQCQAIVFWIRDAIAGESGKPEVESYARVVANACQAARQGTYDFVPAPRGSITVTPDDETGPNVILTDL